MKVAILIIFSLSCVICHSQKLNVIYYGISSDSTHDNHQLELKNDSLLEISTFPRHMSKQFIMTFNYEKTNGTLHVYKKHIKFSDSSGFIKNGYQQFINNLTLTVEGKALIDEKNSLIYVLYKDFKDGFYITYIIDGKTYKQKSGLSDAYGLVKNTPKSNRKLQHKLNSMKIELKNFQIKTYKGLEAYNKFGYKSVFGVIELTPRK